MRYRGAQASVAPRSGAASDVSVRAASAWPGHHDLAGHRRTGRRGVLRLLLPHVSRAMAKIGARDRGHAVIIAYDVGLVDPRG